MITNEIKKAVRLMRDHGLVAGAKAALRKWALSGANVNKDFVNDLKFLLLPDNPASLKFSGANKLKINWLVTGFGIGSGGMFNICRTILYLENKGHECQIYAVGETGASEARLNRLIQRYYFPVRAKLVFLRGETADCDALVATSWRTAYYARSQKNAAKKYYFIQDLEEQFYAQGSIAEFVKNTYRFGFVGLTAGEWIADTLKKTYGMPCFPFGFSYDKSFYPRKGKSKGDGNLKILFYARPESERRGFELGILALSLVAKAHPTVEFVLVGTRDKDWNIPFKATYPGILSIDQLPRLYEKCAVALVISHTNFSLLPLEIMACGCAIVSNDGDNVRWLLNKDVAMIAPSHPEAIASAICELLDDRGLLEKITRAGQAFAISTDWEKEHGKVESAILSNLKMP